MRIIEQLVYKITGDNSEFDKSINQSETKVSKFGSVADKMFAGVTVAAIGMAIKKMGEMVMASANALDRVDKLSQKIGLSRTAFQEWDYILGQSGASVEGLQMSLKTLSGAADEASKGNKQYKDSFDKLGVSVVDANGNMKDQETLFNEVFSALADMENQTERTALASDLLGRSATELAPTLNTSKEGIEQLRSEAHSLGLVYSDELVDAGVILGDNIDRLKKSFDAFKTNALAPIIGLAVTFTDKLLGQYSASGTLKTSYENLTKAAQDYNTVLEASKGKTDAVTQATLSQAKAQLELALQKASENYKDATKEIEKYRKTIDTTTKNIDIYTASLGELSKDTGYTVDALNAMTEKERSKIITEKEGILTAAAYKKQLLERLELQKYLIEATTNLSQAEASQENFINLLTQGYITNNEVTKLLLDAYPELKAAVIGNVEAYKKEQEAIEAEKKATEDAAEAFKAYENMTSEQISTAIKQLELEEKTLTNGKLIELLQKKKIELAGEAAKESENLGAKEQARNEIIEAGNKAMESAEQYALALGSSYDLNAQKASILETTIKALIDSGLTAEDKAVADLTAQLEALGTATEEGTDATAAAYAEIEESRMSDKEKALKAIQDQADAYTKAGVAEADVAQWKSEQVQKYEDEETRKAQEEADKQKAIEEEKTKTRADAYKLLESYSLSEKDKAIANIQAQADEFLEAGVAEVDVEKWKTNELAKLQEEQTKKAKEEADKSRAAWESYATSIASSISSAWSSILKISSNATDTAIGNIEEEYQAKIDALDKDLLGEKEYEKQVSALEAKRDAQKTALAQKQAQREKALAIYEATINTAKAIMQIWADSTAGGVWGKSIWTALAAGAGIAQIAAINSEPLPSYDVGSIRIPETTTATVHKDEMILTAPQAEQARREGITIAPTKSGGNSVNLVIYLDGKEIARNTIDNLNSGSVGTIKARVVK